MYSAFEDKLPDMRTYQQDGTISSAERNDRAET